MVSYSAGRVTCPNDFRRTISNLVLCLHALLCLKRNADASPLDKKKKRKGNNPRPRTSSPTNLTIPSRTPPRLHSRPAPSYRCVRVGRHRRAWPRGQFSSLSIRSGGARHRRAADLPASLELRLSASSPPLGDERLSQGAESGAAARTCRVRARVGTV